MNEVAVLQATAHHVLRMQLHGGFAHMTEQPPEQPAKSVIIKEVTPTVCLNEVYRGDALGELREGRLADIDGATARRFKRGGCATADPMQRCPPRIPPTAVIMTQEL